MIQDSTVPDLPVLPSNLEATDLIYVSRGGVDYHALGTEIQGMTPVNTRAQLVPIQSGGSTLNIGDVVTYSGDDNVDDLPVVSRITNSNTQIVVGIVAGEPIPPNSNGSVYLRGRLEVTLDAGAENEGGLPGHPVYVTGTTGRLTLIKTSRTRVGTILAAGPGATDYVIYADCRNSFQGDTPFVVINSVDDLPPASGGVITLQPVTYLFPRSVNLGSVQLQGIAGTYIRGLGEEVTAISTTLNTGAPFINITAGDAVFEDITIQAPTTGTAIQFNGLSGVHSIHFSDVEITGTTANEGVVITDAAVAEFSNVDMDGLGTGIQLLGSNNGTFRWTAGTASMAAGGTYIDLGTSVSQNITLTSLDFNGISGQTILSGAAASANLALNAAGIVSNCLFGVPGIIFTNISSTDLRWFFNNNRGIKDTRAKGVLIMENNGTSTNITATGAYFAVAGTATLGANASQFTSPSNQVLEYDGLVPKEFNVTVSAGVFQSVVAADYGMRLSILVDGVKVAGSTLGTLQTNIAATPTFNTHVSLSQGSIIQAAVANISNTNNIRVVSMCLTVEEV